MKVQVFGPENNKVLDTLVPKGVYSPLRLKIPADGKTGTYRIFMNARQGTLADELYVPLTSLPGEVYYTGYWSQQQASKFFARSSATAPEEVEVTPAAGSGRVDDRAGKLLGRQPRVIP